jgi:hypothetical protein
MSPTTKRFVFSSNSIFECRRESSLSGTLIVLSDDLPNDAPVFLIRRISSFSGPSITATSSSPLLSVPLLWKTEFPAENLAPASKNHFLLCALPMPMRMLAEKLCPPSRM